MSSTTKRTLMALAACALALGAFSTHATEPAAKPTPTDLEAVFRKPPESARIYSYGWHWISGHITKAGITRDLENMAKAGIGGAIIYNGGNMQVFTGNGRPPTRNWNSCAGPARSPRVARRILRNWALFPDT